MRRIFHALIVLSLIFVSCSGERMKDTELDEAIRQLDAVLGDKEEIEEAKKSRIAGLKAAIYPGMDQDRLYAGLNDIFNEYFQYDIDSTIAYGHKKLDFAVSTGRADLINDAILDIADRYATSGMNDEALSLVSQIDSSTLDREFSKRRLSLLNTIYSNLAASSVDPVLARQYEKERAVVMAGMMSQLGDDDIASAFVGANILMDSGKADEAVELLQRWTEKGDISLNDLGILYYSIATAYRNKGDRQAAKLSLARSARYDLMVPKYEYMSLIELAGMLYEDGDIEHAYTYIMRAVDDAVRANAQACKDNIFNIMPIIAGTYDAKMKTANHMMRVVLVIMAAMLLLLVTLAFQLTKDRRRMHAAERLTAEKNAQLNIINGELRRYNDMLKESDGIKDSYLGIYLNMCSDYIDGLDRYRSDIRKIVKEGDEKDLLNALRSREFMDRQLEEFYSRFDATFLDLFPDFIDQLNELLEEDKQIALSAKDRTLTTELRVLALIRLGVNDSERIAHFLRRSVSTIYNYRVKMRNSAKIDRDKFEKELMKCGKRI